MDTRNQSYTEMYRITSSENSGLLPALMSALNSLAEPSGGNFLRVITSYSDSPSEKISTFNNNNDHVTKMFPITGNLPSQLEVPFLNTLKLLEQHMLE